MQRSSGLHLLIVLASAIAALAAGPGIASDEAAAQQADPVSKGKVITFDRVKGNCLACHVIADGELPGNIAPPLIAMKQRFPDRAALRQQIWDPTASNPESVMPPYGRQKILTEDEIDLVVAYLYSL